MLFAILRYGKSSPESLIVGTVVLCCFLIYQSYFSTSARIRSTIKKKTARRIKDVRSGEVVKIVGSVLAAGRTLIAPLTGRECVFYHVEVEENVLRGRRSGWLTIVDVKKRGDVVLYDGSGYALIRDRKAQAILVPDGQCTSGFLDDALPEMEAFLNEQGLKSTGVLGMNKKLRYYEGILEDGEQCVVVGKATWMKTSVVKLNLPVEKVLVIDSAPNVQSYISDEPEVIGN